MNLCSVRKGQLTGVTAVEPYSRLHGVCKCSHSVRETRMPTGSSNTEFIMDSAGFASFALPKVDVTSPQIMLLNTATRHSSIPYGSSSGWNATKPKSPCYFPRNVCHFSEHGCLSMDVPAQALVLVLRTYQLWKTR